MLGLSHFLEAHLGERLFARILHLIWRKPLAVMIDQGQRVQNPIAIASLATKDE